MPEKLQAIGFGTAERVLVAENHICGIIFEFAGANESATGATLCSARDGEFLSIGIEGGFGVLLHHGVADPVFQGGSRAGVDIVLRRIVRRSATFLHGNEVVWIGSVVLFLLGGRDFVVGLRQDTLKGGNFRIVTKCAKRTNLSHGISKQDYCEAGSPIVYVKRAGFRNCGEGGSFR